MGSFEFLLARFRSSGRRPDADGTDAVERLRQQHQSLVGQLQKTQAGITGCSVEMRRGRRGSAGRRASVKAIADLEAKLVDHFQLEESEGHLIEALRQAPRFHGRVEALRAQHDVLAREMRSLCELAEISGRSVEAWSELDWRLAAFSRRLHAHERAENEIASDVFLEDIGEID